MSDTRIRARLLAAASLVRQGALFADIGTDHAYLPIFLLKEGRVERAFATDINEGPLATARENISLSGLSERVELVLADGASALRDSGATDYAVCGMGGELIADIISRAEQLRDGRVQLILQPMTREGYLRAFLYEHGFEILTEVYSYDMGKYYVTLLARYTGVPVSVSGVDAVLGREGVLRQNADAERGYLEVKLKSYRRAAEGKALGRESDGAEREIIDAILKRLSELKSI